MKITWKNNIIINYYSSSPNGHEGDRNNCFSKIQQVGQKCRAKQLQLAKRDSATIVLVFKAGAFCYYWTITFSLVVAQPIRTQH